VEELTLDSNGFEDIFHHILYFKRIDVSQYRIHIQLSFLFFKLPLKNGG